MKSDAAEEAAEKPRERKLTALGRATLAKMKRKYGEEEGETKFYAAIRSGTLSRASMMQK
jgi:hypothetical protein